jgi:polyphosphate kinase
MTLIDAEIDAAREGRPAWIKARMNSLADPGLIEALYRASMAGVEIDLVVRGICTLRPGMPGLSDRIRVRSIVGRFLEHARVYAFAHGGIWLASADWLPRNLHRRVEVCFPVSDPSLAARLFDEALALPLADAVDAWTLDMDGVWRRLGHGQPARTAHGLRAQQALLARHTAGAGLARGPESRLASRPELPPPPPPMAIGTSASFEGLVPRGPGRLPSDLEGPSRGTRAEP